MVANDRKRNLLSKRRRVEDEGEEDDLIEDLGDDSASEASVLTLDDNTAADVSDPSEIDSNDAAGIVKHINGIKEKTLRGTIPVTKPTVQPADNKSKSTQANDTTFRNTTDMNLMANGWKPDPGNAQAEALDFEESAGGTPSALGLKSNRSQLRRPPLNSKKAFPLDDTDHAESQVQSNHVTSMQASTVQEQASAGSKNHIQTVPSVPRVGGRGRGYGFNGYNQFQRALNSGIPTNEAKWSHDLHETILAPEYANNPLAEQRAHNRIRHSVPPTTQPGSQPTKPSLMSKTVALGTVAARIFLPSMESPLKSDKKITIHQHTRLPDLRPPLRRDKPVRISIPDHAPRYIFPSIERSFIFIPRAQRPNQQGKSRARGYGSRGGSRRTSAYGGSVYSPSIGMSRRGSVARENMMSPAGSAFGRPPPGAPTRPSRPVVRLPSGARMRVPSQALSGTEDPIEIGYPLPSEPVRREHRSSQMQMHHPRPQKQMSVASIEGEQQQDQQAFHQQLPFSITNQPQLDAQDQHQSQQTYPIQSSINTPLHNIPEGAINAQPFQPIHDPEAFYGYPSHPQPMYFYPLPDGQHYPTPYAMAPMASPVYLQPAPYYMPMLMPVAIPSGEEGDPPNAYMQENNGMVYYYDASQFQTPQGMDGVPPNAQIMQPTHITDNFYASGIPQGAEMAYYSQ